MRILGYLDPGSGSMIASAIAAGFAGVVVVFKVGARRAAALVSPKKRRANSESSSTEES